MMKVFLAIASLTAGLSVAAGAFGSHILKERLSDRALEIFEVGCRYQMYHSLALLLIALLLSRAEAVQGWLTASGWAFITGMILFSGSLYALSLSGIKWLGAITPFGGFCFMVGWGCLAIAALSYK
jgi:uncharacterized membrane protein YgdD (TMEM256/DUF423 family)